MFQNALIEIDTDEATRPDDHVLIPVLMPAAMFDDVVRVPTTDIRARYTRMIEWASKQSANTERSQSVGEVRTKAFLDMHSHVRDAVDAAQRLIVASANLSNDEKAEMVSGFTKLLDTAPLIEQSHRESNARYDAIVVAAEAALKQHLASHTGLDLYRLLEENKKKDEKIKELEALLAPKK